MVDVSHVKVTLLLPGVKVALFIFVFTVDVSLRSHCQSCQGLASVLGFCAIIQPV